MSLPDPAISSRYQLPPSQYFKTVLPKDLIVLHFTAGTSAEGAFAGWMQSAVQVATPFLVDLDGAIYQVYDPKYWAYHLGIRGIVSENWKHDRRSIGIEIVNPGPLKPDRANPDQLNWWPGDFQTRWCNRRETSKYVERHYRGFDYFAAFPEAQMQSVTILVNYLSARFGIPKRIPSPAKRSEFDVRFFSGFQGIASHQNFRDDKTDIGPAFDWSQLLVKE